MDSQTIGEEKSVGKRAKIGAATAAIAASASFLWRQKRRRFSRKTKRESSQYLTTSTSNNSANAVCSDGEINAKKVFLIRHAKSLENARTESLVRSAKDLTRFRIPSQKDVRRASELLDIRSQVDSDVSDVGLEEIENVAQQLRADDFLVQNNVRLVAHSPLKRARRTCEGMLGCVAEIKGDGDGSDDTSVRASWYGGYKYGSRKGSSSFVAQSSSMTSSFQEEVLVPPVTRVDELPCLLEKAMAEWIPGNSGKFTDRIAAFEAWLSGQPEPVVAIVGHSQFFRAMLGLENLFDNCDVWEVTWNGSWQEEHSSSRSNAAASDDDKDNVSKEAEEKNDIPADSGVKSIRNGLPRGWSNLRKRYGVERNGSNEEMTATL